uniref:Divergent coat protein n=1 Tax=Grapevine leafroll-associated virus 3 TaxID=55951 RepID=E5KH02_9CLOS|nr:divergent coat protein [Grapevine leafroll-associated virus 3]ADQ57703.1 divergent coat protein [Grapevine leafroll-associated virus 3]ADQ57710.1 divergent coat protein [Grapevine leafroll-associated virus 3]ADQ57717.1 divergent coat protein [Grapevine leafroll-associated virus 3]ADQ57731.1 divergent coat protein [Grapevine leafroll-associated virus 3]
MGAYTHVDFHESRLLKDKQDYLSFKSANEAPPDPPGYVRPDSYVRAYLIQRADFPDTQSLSVTLSIASNKLASGLMGSDAVSSSFMLMNDAGDYFECGVCHNKPYLGREVIFCRKYLGGRGVEITTGKNYTSNNWNEASYVIQVNVVDGLAQTTVNSTYTQTDVSGLPKNWTRIYKITKIVSVDQNLYPGCFSDSKLGVMRIRSLLVSPVRIFFRDILLKPLKKSFNARIEDVLNIDDASLSVPSPVVPESTGGVGPSEQLDVVALTSDVTELINTRGQGKICFPDSVLSINEADIYDERYLPITEALQINARLRRLVLSKGGSQTPRDMGNMIVAMIQLFVLYSTVKNISVKDGYRVETELGQKKVYLSYSEVREAILGGKYDASPTNTVRSFMRYFTHTTITLLIEKKIQPAYTALAKHGVPKRFTPYCFDFALLDNRYYPADVLKANAMACAIAIKSANLRRKGSETYNILESI